MIEAKSLGSKPYETLCRVARYYIDEYGCSKKDARKKLDDFLLQCDPSYSLVKWSGTADRAVNQAFKRKAVSIDAITLTKTELDAINAVDGIQAQRLAFTLLCLARYWDIVNETSEHWVNTKDSDIMKLANISASIRRQSLMYNQLNSLGMIQFSKRVDSTNVRVTFCEPGDTAVTVTDLRNLGYQYLKYRGRPYGVCEHCGITFKLNNPGVGRPQKYCRSCAVQVAIQQRVNSVMKQRNLSKQNCKC